MQSGERASVIPSTRVAADRRRLWSWYEPRRAAYPWRSAVPDPYRVLVSEVMLQQTQARRVVPIFEAFVARFPGVGSLAEASLADVVRAWEGLGYHRRAVALHGAARTIVERHGAHVPSGIDELRALPGVGPYTASAVASIGFGATIAALDTNVRRISARYLLGREPDEIPARTLRAAADPWVSPSRPGDWNQALMDLGREVCRPRPRCELCPLRACRFRAAERTGRSSSRRQPAFDGSLRQVRGRVLAMLRERPSVTEASLARELGFPRARVTEAVEGLVNDGLAARATRGRITLAA